MTSALLAYVSRYRWQTGIALAALLGASASLLAIPHFIGRLVDELAAGRDASLGALASWLLLCGALYACCTALRAYMVNWIGDRVITDLRVRVYQHLLSLPARFFQQRATGELLSRISNDITALQIVISIVIVIGLRSVVQLAGALGMMVLTSWQLALIALAMTPVVGGVVKLLGRRIRARSAVNREREADTVIQLEESLNGIETIKAFTLENAHRERFRRAAELCFDSAESLIRARSEILLAVAALLLVALGVLGAVGLRQLGAGELSGGTLAQFGLYLSVVAFSVLGLGDIHGELRKAAGATERVFALLDEVPEASGDAGQPLPPGRGALELADVGYSYPGRPEVRVLQNIDLALRPGEIVALTGPSGAGKTTIFRLLLGFESPQQGAIRLDGVDISRLDRAALRGALAMVPQEPLVFSGSALDNIRLARPEASEAEIVHAAKLAQAHEFLSALPAGYRTSLGNKGHALSAGQRQRIAIARAILRRPRLLLLDEATSHLDVESEAALHQALLPFLRTCTTLVISHRPSLVRAADRVVVLERGRITAEGRHEALAGNTFYCNLMD